MKLVRESLNFERGKDPKDALDLGEKIILNLCNGFRIEGFLRNKEAAKKLIKTINAAMRKAYAEADSNDEFESVAMDDRDDVFYEYEEQLEDIGFKLIDE